MNRATSNKKTVKKLVSKQYIDAAIAEGLKDIAAGREIGPFETAEELIAHLHKQVKVNI